LQEQLYEQRSESQQRTVRQDTPKANRLLGAMGCCFQSPFPLEAPRLKEVRPKKVQIHSEPKDVGSPRAEVPEDSSEAESTEAFYRTFGLDVEQLGFRIAWNALPSVQMLEEGSAAQACGLKNEDVILEINGMETEGKERSELLPKLKERPLELKIQRPAAQATRPVSSLQANLAMYQAHSTNSIFSEPEARAQMDEESREKLGLSPNRSGSMKLGLKKYLEEEDVPETMVTRTVRFLTKVTGNEEHKISRAERLFVAAASFAQWWDGLTEPPRRGWLPDFIEGRSFKSFSAMVIIVNAVVVTWLTDWSLSNGGKNMPPGFEFVDLAFLLFYVVEVSLRLSVNRGYFFVNDNAAWNIFDLLLVVFSSLDVISTWPGAGEETPPNNLGYMRVFRMFKFAKILRTIRIISFVRELSMMLESFRKCMIAMFWGLVLLMFLLYVFALIFAQGVASFLATKDSELLPPEDVAIMMAEFGSVGNSMLSLYMAVTGGNDWNAYYFVMDLMGSFYPAVFLIYTFFFIFALFNILTGVFVERAVAASLPDREELISEERKKLCKQVEELRALFKALDTDGSGMITKHEFLNDMQDARVVSYMHSLGLEMHDAEKFFDIIAENSKEVDIDTFIEHGMSMKGSATALDMQRQLLQTSKVAERLHAWETKHWPRVLRSLRRLEGDDRKSEARPRMQTVSSLRSTQSPRSE